MSNPARFSSPKFACRGCRCRVQFIMPTAAEANAAYNARLCRNCQVARFTAAAKGKTQLAAAGKSRTVWLTFPPAAHVSLDQRPSR